ncbi:MULTISPECIES: S4 domain-containing protein YaaA [Streptococcus]|nr:S4 domain-containing protein YaaA [Streptococcus hyointestinalis]MCI6871340.1 S4 domain-containing protein YaaA [Streptococcus hyointestinalis]MDY3823220.1 S4 domain-containing protein YaaA [Streptococcus sp.]
MQYKLFNEFITLQALLKELSIIPSGGAIKAFLSENDVYFNGALETRRGKKLRLNDCITIPELEIEILLIEPSLEEKAKHQEELDEKARVAALVKKLNQENKKKSIKKKTTPSRKNPTQTQQKKPIRFPGI